MTQTYPFVSVFEPTLRLLYKTINPCVTEGCHMDVFLPEANQRIASAPIVIFIHGGAFTQGSSKDVPFNQISWFLEKGAVCVSLEYRLAPHAHFSDIREDLRDAFIYLQKDLHDALKEGGMSLEIDTKRYAITGSSAGGTSTLLMTSEILKLYENDLEIPPPSAVMPAFPLIFNEGETENCKPRSAMKEMFNNTPQWNRIQELFEQPVCVSDPYPADVFNPDLTKPRIAFVNAGFASKSLNAFIMGRDPPFGPEGDFTNLITPTWPPTAVLCAMQDNLIPVRHSLALVDKLQNEGVEVRKVEVEADHGFCDLPASYFPDKAPIWWKESIEPSLEWIWKKLEKGRA